MPIYSFKCKRCEHRSEKGFTVAGFTAQVEQGFMFLKCGRCRRRAVLEHDFMADAKTQSSHRDEYTFSENAPEERLVGQTVSKKEAKEILKRHGLVESGREGKRNSSSQRRRHTEAEIMERWREKREAEPATEKQPRAEVAAEATAPVPPTKIDKKSLNLLLSDNLSRQGGVDSDNMSKVTIAPTWPGLKKQARGLGINIPRTMKRPELERLVRTTLVS